MNSLSVDNFGNLVLDYELSGDYETDYDLFDTVDAGVGPPAVPASTIIRPFR